MFSNVRTRGSKGQNRPHLKTESYFSSYMLWMSISEEQYQIVRKSQVWKKILVSINGHSKSQS